MLTVLGFMRNFVCAFLLISVIMLEQCSSLICSIMFGNHLSMTDLLSP